MERLWTKYFEKLRGTWVFRKFRNEYEFNSINSMINISLSSLDKYVAECGNKIGCKTLMEEMIDEILLVVQKYHAGITFEGARELSNRISKIVSIYHKRMITKEWYSENKFINKVTTNIVDQIMFQEDPKNRIVSKVYIESVASGELIYSKVYIDSDCNGWAVDEHKFFGYILGTDLKDNLTGITEDELSKMEEFDELEILKKGMKMINEDNVPYEIEDGDKYVDTNKSKFASFLEGLACSCLIKSDGSCNWDNIYKLRKCDLNVFAGEQDSFGWLTGCIKNPDNGIILVYG